MRFGRVSVGPGDGGDRPQITDGPLGIRVVSTALHRAGGPSRFRCMRLMKSGGGVRPYDIRPGNALMDYPEANVLVPGEVDPQSRTPAFKSMAVKLVAEHTNP